MQLDFSTILILNVDDNDGARYAKSRILQVAGFNVIEAANGIDALRLVTERQPDLVLLDVKLPDINGIEVCRRIKAETSSATVLVLQTSAALTGRADKIRGLEGGADNYLAAPIEADELIANVNALLRLRRTQVALAESEERFRQMADNIRDVFWIFSIADKQLLYVSPAYSLFWGARPGQLAEDPMSWLAAVHPDDRDRIRQHFQEQFDGRPYDEEYRLLDAERGVRWIRDRCYFVRDNEDKIYRIARISTDITAAKQAELDLQEADIHKDEFLATLAHELRNPLGPIRNALELMRRVDPANTQAHTRSQQLISRQVDHLARLVDDLLDVARISKGKITLQHLPVELAMFVHSAVETTRPLIDIRNHHFELSLPDASIWVRGDPVRLAQIVGNLLNNAAKYTPRGGKINLTAGAVGGKLRLVVQDNGIGIPPERLVKIFGMFTQGNTSPDRAQDGLGIGLSLVKQLTELHGGKIWAESSPHEAGSRFILELPILEGEHLPSPERSPALPNRPAQSLTVLIVDDNPDSVNITAMLLQNLGYSTFTAHDALSALAMAKQNLPDVILLDIGLPGTDGYEVARRIRLQPELRAARLIAITGYGTEVDKKKAMEAGFDHHLVKPASLENLMAVISHP